MENILFGDPARLEQVLWNLLKNAVKFTPSGGSVTMRCFKARDLFMVEVSDTGVGFEPDAQGRLFKDFEQVDQGITRQFGGLGLGLAISKRIIEMHGGSITAGSPGKGRGAKFQVALPKTASLVDSTSSRGPETAEASQKNLKILVVEDNKDTASMLSLVLNSLGYTVETAGGVESALECIHEMHFDIILSDLGLPDRSGFDLMRELRMQGEQVKAIALSGYGREEDVRKSKEAGFLEHLTKPVDVSRLEKAVAQLSSHG